mgnify:CR=1 FL=1
MKSSDDFQYFRNLILEALDTFEFKNINLTTNKSRGLVADQIIEHIIRDWEDEDGEES